MAHHEHAIEPSAESKAHRARAVTGGAASDDVAHLGRMREGWARGRMGAASRSAPQREDGSGARPSTAHARLPTVDVHGSHRAVGAHADAAPTEDLAPNQLVVGGAYLPVTSEVARLLDF